MIRKGRHATELFSLKTDWVIETVCVHVCVHVLGLKLQRNSRKALENRTVSGHQLNTHIQSSDRS